MNIQAIIPSAGIGVRLKNKISKPVIELAGKPIIIHTLEAFEGCSLITSIILVVADEQLSTITDLVKQFSFKKIKHIVIGGQTRCDSVYNGINVLDDDVAFVVVHDGARPLISSKSIEEVIEECKAYDAVAMAVPVKSTIKRVKTEQDRTFTVLETLIRDELWETQTPQVFKSAVLVKAHENYRESRLVAEGKEIISEPTDDASLVERLGVEVKIHQGSYQNIKITTPEDIEIAQAFL